MEDFSQTHGREDDIVVKDKETRSRKIPQLCHVRDIQTAKLPEEFKDGLAVTT